MDEYKEIKKTIKKESKFSIALKRFKRHKLGLIGFWVLVVLYTLMIFCPFFAPYGPTTKMENPTGDPKNLFKCPPTPIQIDGEGLYVRGYVLVQEYGITQHLPLKDVKHRIGFFVKGDEYKLFGFIPWDIHLFGTTDGGPIYIMGTDESGRDLFSRILYGSIISLTIGFVGVFISLIMGVTIGGFSGYVGGNTDWIIMRFIEFIILFPTFYLWLFLRGILSDQMQMSPTEMYITLTLIFSFVGWTGQARVIRGMVLSIKSKDFVTAARIQGIGNFRIIMRHIIPETVNILIVSVSLAIPGFILGESALSFLGLGITEPSVSWGSLLNVAMDISVLQDQPWMIIPGIFIIVTVVAFNLVGDALRDAFDPMVKL